MRVELPADLETLVNKRLSTGAYASAEDVLRRALEAQDAVESWTDEERRAFSAHIEEGYRQAERGELIESSQARSEIQIMKENWRGGVRPLDERIRPDASRESRYFRDLVPHS